MRKALAQLDDGERYQLIYLTDLTTSLCMSGLIVSIFHGITSQFSV
ncbi:hypothetical protein L6654_33865 [Bradyrhizobium sp. WYCCWR 13023]|uniref:Uncharacterized protein n=1 Tax=Bradyrhizobium zhengyangense TaxID=2911009 RepID=A0A9X1RCF4_9BRAD|nr:hypothetical protein [Bradyrhizobium zhengyangense]MCG2631627.1 hypothetical protein [Bradyrhizobium zhengyangense]